MAIRPDDKPGTLVPELQQLTEAITTIAQRHRSDPLVLLSILRCLEQLHSEITTGLFQEVLPDNRQELYALLREIESSGGWPYIPRMRLQDLLINYLAEKKSDPASEAG